MMRSAAPDIASSSSSLHATDHSRVADEVLSSVIAMRACEENLARLIALSREHNNLLAKRPADAASVERTIKTAWTDLLTAKPVLERCGSSARGDKTALRHRLRWKMVDRKKYRLLATSVSRNDTDVQNQIEHLEQIVRSNPLEVLTEAAREEESRRRREIDQVRTRREIDGLSILDPIEYPVAPEAGTSQAFLSDSGSASPDLSRTLLHPPYAQPPRRTPRDSMRSADSFTESWSRERRTLTSNRSITTFSADSTLTGSLVPISNLDGLLALGPDETPF